MQPTNRFLNSQDYRLLSFIALRKEFESLYSDVFGKIPETYGSKYQNQSRIHWSRDWEYPWAVLSSHVLAGERVLDCGCGGSPLLPFLAKHGCMAYGIDTYEHKRRSLLQYYRDLFKKAGKYSVQPKSGSRKKRGYSDYISLFFKCLKGENNLWYYRKDPNKMGFRIRFFRESLTDMHFENNFFDKVYCISVIEHLKKDDAYRGMKEMARVLRPRGLLTMTLDNDGPHVNPDLVGKYMDLIRASGLRLHGKSDFTLPEKENLPGKYNVLGIVLEK